MPGTYGHGAPIAMQPGDRALLVGHEFIPGFQGNIPPSGNGSSTDSEGDYPETLLAGQASGPVVIAAMGGRHPSTQRQLIWRVFPLNGGAVNVSLQASIDDVAANYTTIDTYNGTGNSGPRELVADIQNSGTPPQPQSAGKNLGAARFLRVINNAGSSATLIADCTSL
jgi:hypothetical protein